MAEALSRRKVALVTGGTRGIGHGIAENLAREGFDLILGYLKDDESARLTKLKFEKEYQAKVSLVKGDILLPETLEHFFKELETNHSNRLDALIHNAGTAHVSRVPGLATCLDSYDAAQEMYPKFFIRVVEKAIKVMHKGEGRIVAISSQGVHNPSPSFAVGAAAKAAMEVIAKHYAFVLAPLGITVNVVVPGFVRTDAWEPYLRHSNLNETPALVTPMGRWGFPSDISPLVTFLCSSEARWITGQIIQIDGGFGMSLFESVATVEKVVGSMASADHSSGTRARRSTLTDNKTPSINTLLEKTRETMLERNKETLRQKLEKLALKKEEKDEAPEDKEKEKEKDKGSADETAK